MCSNVRGGIFIGFFLKLAFKPFLKSTGHVCLLKEFKNYLGNLGGHSLNILVLRAITNS